MTVEFWWKFSWEKNIQSFFFSVGIIFKIKSRLFFQFTNNTRGIFFFSRFLWVILPTFHWPQRFHQLDRVVIAFFYIIFSLSFLIADKIFLFILLMLLNGISNFLKFYIKNFFFHTNITNKCSFRSTFGVEISIPKIL